MAIRCLLVMLDTPPPPPPTHKAMFVSDIPVIDCPRELTAAASEAVAFGGRIAGNIMMLVLSGCAVRLDVISAGV